jgi:hypothetical protein
MSKTIWFKDPKNFITPDNYDQFFPEKSMNFNEQLNSLLRLSIYFSLIVFVLKYDIRIFLVPLVTALFTWFLYNIDQQNKDSKEKFLESKNLAENKKDNTLCIKPTKDNPFMNITMNEYADNPQRKPACDITKNSIKTKAKEYFDHNMYRDVGDVYESQTTDRQWVTNPITTIPNDQVEFAKWLYNTGPTCKENNGNQCSINIGI